MQIGPNYGKARQRRFWVVAEAVVQVVCDLSGMALMSGRCPLRWHMLKSSHRLTMMTLAEAEAGRGYNILIIKYK
jgi:hypothetical protein